jgi:amino acid adenylation domain-containing protein
MARLLGKPLDMSDYPIVRRLLEMPREWESRTAYSAAAGSLTFAALRADMLAFAGWLVREAGVKPGDRVAICLPKTLETMRAICGVLAAGGAHVILPFRGPPARLRALLASVEPRLLLTTAETSAQLAAEAGHAALPPTLHVEAADGGQGLAALLRSARPLADTVAVRPEDLAAIFFTSGSTGEPKGVMRSQRNMLHHLTSMARVEAVGPQDICPGNAALQYTSPIPLFPLLSGCRVHLLTDQEVMFPEFVAETLERERATLMHSAAAGLRLIVERADLGKRDLRSMRRLSSHGELLSPEILRALLAGFPEASVHSIYGSTEAPGMAGFAVPRPLPADLQTVPLGRFHDHYVGLICDEDGLEVPPGEVGEICVTGPMISVGYWKDPELTASRRLNGLPDSYRTGDLAFATPDGMLHFAGRRDHQVKLRGHRFDLGEIEAVLKRHPAVREAVAFAVADGGGEFAVQALVEAPAQAGLDRALKEICAERLPRYAWPAGVSIREKLPRLASGKVDRQALRRTMEIEG